MSAPETESADFPLLKESPASTGQFESVEERRVRDRWNAFQDSKHVAFYANSLAGWFATMLEHDKSLLVLSVAGLGFLANYGNSGGPHTTIEFWVFCIGISGFLIATVLVLFILLLNGRHVENVLAEADGATPVDPRESLPQSDRTKYRLTWLRRTSYFVFSIAAAAATVISVSSAHRILESSLQSNIRLGEGSHPQALSRYHK